MIDINLINQYIAAFFDQFSTMSSWQIIWNLLFIYQGWLIFIIIFIKYFLWPEYMIYIRDKWFSKTFTPVLLAIDVPKRNEQSVQAMENFFDHLQGAHGTINWWQTYIDGEFQLSFSCELVSIDGNVQFLIRTAKHLRSLVEAAVYGQYPDAEITEVEDYVNSVPKLFPNDTHDLWGCELSLSGKEVYYPLKSYLKFQDRFGEQVFVDPMAALLETMSSIGPGEQIWLQYLIKPLEVGWGLKGGQKLVNKTLQIKEKSSAPGMLGIAASEFSTLLGEFTQELVGTSWIQSEERKEDKADATMLRLSPLQRELLEGIERKISKLAFNTKIRLIYIAEKGKMNKAIGVNGIIGAIKQWTDMNSNGLKPMLKETGTNSPFYYLKDYRRNARRNKIIAAYRGRDNDMGMPGKPLCSEELASLWHFPSMYIKAPLLKTTAFKKAAAPVGLPLIEGMPVIQAPAKPEEVVGEKEQVTPTFDYDTDKFEMQFAKDKEEYKESRAMHEKRSEELAREDAEELKKEGAKNQKEEKSVRSQKLGKKKEAPTNLPFVE